MTVAVVGLGKLGLPLALLLAETGFDVLGVDTNPEHLARLKVGETPWHERHLPEMLVDHGPKIDWRSDPADAGDCDVVFIVVPTPSLPSGAFDVSLVESVVSTVPETARNGVSPVLCVVSTTNPGDCARIAERATQPLVYSPEFIALGDVFAGMRRPDLLLIGETDKAAGNAVLSCLRAIRPGTPDGVPPGQHFIPTAPAIHRLTPTEAEIAKLSLNVGLTVKIALANTIGALVAAYDGRPMLVADAVGADHRIGRAFLSPGPPPAGPCLPRDGDAFTAAALERGMETPLVEGVKRANLRQVGYIVDRVAGLATVWDAVVLLGMSYKVGAAVDTGAIGVRLNVALDNLGYRCETYDPLLISIYATGQDAVNNGTLVVLCTDDPGWCDLDYTGKVVVDLWGLPINTDGVDIYMGPS